MPASALGHRERPTLVAHQQARGDRGDGRREVQALGPRVARGDQGERDEDFDLVVVDALQHQVGQQTEQEPERGSPQHLPDDQHEQIERQDAGVRYGSVPELEKGEKDDHAHAVVEQRLAGDRNLDVPWRPERFQHAQHRDGIGRGDERPEEQAVKRRQAQIQRAGEEPAEPADDAGREEGAHHGQDPDGGPVVAQIAQLDVERPGEEQEPEGSVQQELVEIDHREEALGVHLDRRVDQRETDENQGQGEPHGHDADGDGEPGVAVVDPAERRGEDHQHCQQIEYGHCAPSSVDDSTRKPRARPYPPRAAGYRRPSCSTIGPRASTGR